MCVDGLAALLAASFPASAPRACLSSKPCMPGTALDWLCARTSTTHQQAEEARHLGCILVLLVDM